MENLGAPSAKLISVRMAAALASLALLSMPLAACGDKSASSDASTVKAGENVPPPTGQKWTDTVSVTEAGGYAMGNPEAAIKVVEFGSYTCPHCRDFMSESSEEVDKMVETGKMSFEYRPFVRDPIDMTMALLAECGEPEIFFPLSHQLFDNQVAMFEKVQGAGDAAYQQAMQKPAEQRFIALAELGGLLDFVKQRGLAEDKAKQCLADGKKAEALAAQVQQATEKYDISGTPTLLLNNRVVENVASWPAMRSKLQETGL